MPHPEPRTMALVSACLNAGSEAAWRELVELFQPVIAGVILRTIQRFGRIDRALADDLVQETFVRLCKDDFKALRTFQSRHENSIFAFLKVVAASAAMDHFRSRSAEKRAAGVEARNESDLDSIPAPISSLPNRVLLSQIASRLDGVTKSERDQAIFWLYYQQGYSAKDISHIPGVNLSDKGVESLLFRLTQAIRRQMSSHELGHRSEGTLPSTSVGEGR